MNCDERRRCFAEAGYEIVVDALTGVGLDYLKARSDAILKRGHLAFGHNGWASQVEELPRRLSPWSLFSAAFREGIDCLLANEAPVLGGIQFTYSTSSPSWGDHGEHVDGAAAEDKYIRRVTRYQCLVGILLSEVAGEDCGSLLVWPQSHETNAAFLRAHGTADLYEAMIGIPRHGGIRVPVPFTGGPGSTIVTHHLLSHATARNLTPVPRQMAFFRIDCAILGERLKVAGSGFDDLRRGWA